MFSGICWHSYKGKECLTVIELVVISKNKLGQSVPLSCRQKILQYIATALCDAIGKSFQVVHSIFWDSQQLDATSPLYAPGYCYSQLASFYLILKTNIIIIPMNVIIHFFLQLYVQQSKRNGRPYTSITAIIIIVDDTTL